MEMCPTQSTEIPRISTDSKKKKVRRGWKKSKKRGKDVELRSNHQQLTLNSFLAKGKSMQEAQLKDSQQA